LLKYIFTILLVFSAPLLSQEKPIRKWVVYYGDRLPVKEFFPFQLVVMDTQHHIPLEGFRENNMTILGYINLGEIEERQHIFKDPLIKQFLLQENPHWKGSYFVDLRHKAWVKLVIEELIPQTLFAGFDGIFIDTLDNAEFLEQTDPEKFKGMKEAAGNLIKTIRYHYPGIKIMVNRAYYLLPVIGDIINMELGESVYTTYNFKTKEYEFVSTEDYQLQVEILQKAKKDFKNLQVFTLDYWNPKDKEMYKNIYKLQRDNGFTPYVSTLSLDTVITEP
jgi:uncharacterized protein (TIGR01370 family)